MDQDNTRNTIIFVVVAMVLMMAYQFLVLAPIQQRRAAEQRAAQVAAVSHPLVAAQPGSSSFVSREQALAASPRVKIDSPALQGSIALKGGRIDDLFMKDYRETISKTSPPVELFRPEGAKQAYFADFGWAGQNVLLPRADTVWTAKGNQTLKPGQPVSLTWDNGQGLSFTRTPAIDEHFMFTVTSSVANTGKAAVQMAPYASVQRQGMPTLQPINIIHEGAIGSVTGALKLLPYKDWKKKGEQAADTTGGWMGVTDHYWLAAVIPDQKEAVHSAFRVTSALGVDVFEANYVGQPRTLAPGQTTTETTHLFAGAKKVSILQGYQDTLGVPKFVDAVDWGNFWFLTKPIFFVLAQLYKVLGNFGVSILALTVLVKLLLFPLANKSFESMSKMKNLQPEMEAIKKRFPDDATKQQQETMELYKREKVNPVAGCLPVLVQIPVWYALYKVLYVTLEMRHAPFFGWIRDLSAPDPTSFVNLFGLIPWNPATTPLIGGILGTTLAIGVWPILYGLVQWLNTQMSPQPNVDPTQKLMFQLFPLIFTVMLAHSPAGILIYWVWSSTLTIVQQYYIMHSFKAQNPIDDFIAKVKNRTAAA